LFLLHSALFYWPKVLGELVSEVTTRLFEASDLRAVYAIEEACFEPPLRFSRMLIRSLAFDADCRIWMGVVDNVCAGFAIVSLRSRDALPDTATDPENAYIWTVEVLPVFRRMGMARQLLVRVEESAREAGCAALELHVSERNHNAIALYADAGYEASGVERDYYGPEGDGLRYRKLLA
jgi:ribosomal protein S18 acetylase RimI-like enzyme